MSRYARDQGADGLAGIPCAWGYKPNHHGGAGHDGGGRPRIGNLDDSYHRLAMLNFDVFQAVMNDPDADLERVLAAALRRRYGQKLPKRMTQLLVESQSIRAGINNCRGIQSTGETLERMYYQILRYGPTVKGWKRRLSREASNLKRIIREKEAAMQRAVDAVKEIESLPGNIPAAARDEFLSCFSDLRDEGLLIGRRQILHFLLWALKDGQIKPEMATIQLIEQQLRNDSRSLQG